MGTRIQLGDLQLAILRILWRDGESTVARIHEELAGARGSALTTIATMLSKMEARGLVDHRRESRHYVYHAIVSEEQARRSMVSDVTRRLFEGDALALVSHLVHEQELGPSDLEAIRAMIEARKRGDDEDEAGAGK